MIKYSCKDGHVELETVGTVQTVVTDAVFLPVTLYRRMLQEDPRMAKAFRTLYTKTLMYALDEEERNM